MVCLAACLGSLSLIHEKPSAILDFLVYIRLKATRHGGLFFIRKTLKEVVFKLSECAEAAQFFSEDANHSAGNLRPAAAGLFGGSTWSPKALLVVCHSTQKLD